MPSEIRHVIFSMAEVLEAVVAHRRRAGHPLPVGSVLTAAAEAPMPDAPLRFRIVIARDSAAGIERSTVLEIPASELIVTLLGYCRGRGIPIPMRAEKAVQMFGARLGLVRTMGASARERAALATAG